MSDLVIETRGLYKRFGDFVAVSDLNMQIERGKVHGFLGPNGSGKTTAIRMMCGLMTPSQGDVRVLDMDVATQAPTIRKQVGYMTQRFSQYQDLTIEENLQFLARIHGLPRKARKPRIDEVMKRVNLFEFKDRLAGPLSGGQKRRLALGGAILTQPKLLILDEPTSEVDPNTRREMWSLFFNLANEGTSILVSTHLMDEAERCHNLTMLAHGVKKADGPTEQLKHDLPQKVVSVEGPQVTPLADALDKDPQIVAATQTGLTLRVLTHEGLDDPVAYVQGLCGDAYQCALIPASIEDVFVAATRD